MRGSKSKTQTRTHRYDVDYAHADPSQWDRPRYNSADHYAHAAGPPYMNGPRGYSQRQ